MDVVTRPAAFGRARSRDRTSRGALGCGLRAEVRPWETASKRL